MSREGSPEPRTAVEHAPTAAFVREFGAAEAQAQAAKFTVPSWAQKVNAQSVPVPRTQQQRTVITQEELLLLCAMGAGIGLLFWLVFLR